MRPQVSVKLLLGATVVAGLLLGPACEKEDDQVGPVPSRPDLAVVTTSKDTVLTAGRDSSLWTVQLYRQGAPFTTPYAATLLTDLGYFKVGGLDVLRATIATDAGGRGTVHFYGGNVPGFATTLVWGDGFGIDTVRTVLAFGTANTLRVEFRDFAEDVWKPGDTLASGTSRGRADSNQVRVTVLDGGGVPVPGVVVDLAVLRNGVKVTRSLLGYFKGTIKPDSIATSTVVTDAGGQAFEVYYTDDLPNTGTMVAQITARVDSALFGRAVSTKSLLLRAP